MPKKTHRVDLITTKFITDATTQHLAKLLKTSVNKVHRYLRGDVGVMTRDDEMIMLKHVKESLYRKALGYHVDEVEITRNYDRKGFPIDDWKTGCHTTVKVTRKYIKPELQAIQAVLEKFDPGFLNSLDNEAVKFLDDISEVDG
jgi:predicted transcriptional regulator